MSHLSPSSDPVESLRPVYDELRGMLREFGEETLVIVDDLSSLVWIGVSTQEVSRFTRAICALCRKVRALQYSQQAAYLNPRQANVSLVLRHHVVTPGELDDLLRLLLQLCTYRVEVFPLASGRSGSVSGQVCLSTVDIRSTLV